MVLARLRPAISILALALLLCACDGLRTSPPDDLIGPGTGPPDTTNPDPNPDSVGDVTVTDPGSDPTTQPLPPAGPVSARVRNESDSQADVTLRFIRDQSVVHLAFVRVLSNTETTVTSPKSADLIEFLGVDATGRALETGSLEYGSDFDEETPALYVIPPIVVDDPPDLGPLTLELLQPAADVTLVLGSTLLVRWTDSDTSPTALVRVLLDPVGANSSADPTVLGPAVGASLDGINDELQVVVQGIDEGLYEVLGEIDDGQSVVTARAPGLVQVMVDPGNAAPTLSISSPLELIELSAGDSLALEWDDEDEDDNATIRFSLEVFEPSGVGIAPFAIGPPLAEDPDENGTDSASFAIADVLPGLYDLVGTIDDGELIGTARVEAVVRVLPEPENDQPTLTLLKPDVDIEVEVGGAFTVRWIDSDEDNNALITIMLDPDLEGSVLDGNEIVLVGSLGEDEDGSGDRITLGVPEGEELQAYRLVAVITDGSVEVITWAPGVLYYGVTISGENGTLNTELRLLHPAESVQSRVVESIPLYVETVDVPEETVIRLFLDNQPYGGSTRAEVTPVDLVRDEFTTLRLLGSGDQPANSAWPRKFDVVAEAVVEGTTFTATAPAPVWIRQEVEVISVRQVNYSCGTGELPPRDGREFIGLEIEWIGGGFQARDAHRDVQFWLSADGAVPDDGLSDNNHLLVGTKPESPNVERLIQVDILRTSGLPGILTGDGSPTLEPGDYQVITVVDTVQFGRIVSEPHDGIIALCLRPVIPELP